MMKTFKYLPLILPLIILFGDLRAEVIDLAKAEQTDGVFDAAKHSEGAKQLAYDQDDLSADVQDLIDEQTDPKLIGLLREVEIVMADAIDLLEDEDTGGATIATQTEIIEKIFDAAKQKQQSGEG